MALTVLIKEDGGDLSLTLDAPRIVIGRSKSCEVQLPDPTVSARHACIRMQGGRNLVVDEGSTNGLTVGSVRLPPHTPRVVSDGEMIRVGRVWLELRFGAGMPSTPKEVRGVAMSLLARQLAAAGEPLVARIEVLAAGQRAEAPIFLTLSEHDRDYVIGRAADSDLQLGDELASRRHVAVSREGDRWMVRDMGSKRGTTLADSPLDTTETMWRDGDELVIGDTTLVMRDPLASALDEAWSSADVKMRPAEHEQLPPGLPTDKVAAPAVVEAPIEGAAPEQDDIKPDDGLHDDAEPVDVSPLTPMPQMGPSRGMAAASLDLLVALVAIGLMTLSIAGLMYVLG